MFKGNLNCWEFIACGRHPGGEKAKELGVCPATTNLKANGINDGRNGGRACWAIAGTFCGGKIQGAFAEKLGQCLSCEFYNLVREEQRGSKYLNSRQILKIINGEK